MIAALAPALSAAVCTELPDYPADGPINASGVDLPARRRSWGAQDLVRLARDARLEDVRAEPDFAAALTLASEIAAEVGGTLLVTGSHYVLGPARAALA